MMGAVCQSSDLRRCREQKNQQKAEFERTKLPNENSENINAVRKNKLEKCH